MAKRKRAEKVMRNLKKTQGIQKKSGFSISILYKALLIFAGVIIPLLTFFAISNIDDVKEKVIETLSEELTFSTVIVAYDREKEQMFVAFSANNLSSSPVVIYNYLLVNGLEFANQTNEDNRTLLEGATESLEAMRRDGVNSINILLKPGEQRLIVNYSSDFMVPGKGTMVISTSSGTKVVAADVSDSPFGDAMKDIGFGNIK